jgi:hypothetical protein
VRVAPCPLWLYRVYLASGIFAELLCGENSREIGVFTAIFVAGGFAPVDCWSAI